MADPRCHYCERPAEAECSTCGRLYCAEHGDDVCLRCMAPEAAAPAALAYRGALVALVVCSLVVVYLLVRPPATKSAEDVVRTVPTPTSAISATATPTRPGTRTVTATAVTATATATAGTPTPPATDRTYTVKSGDNLSSIAAQFNTTVAAILAANPGVSAEALQIGTVLKIPGAQ